jgi:exopolysaccharide biosynthesis polyprenyl glycosylphosphotransferase
MLSTQTKSAVFLLFLDSLSILVVFGLGGYLRGIDIHEFPLEVMLIPVGLVVAALYLIDGYKPRTDMMSLDYTSQHAIALLSAMICLLLLSFVVISDNFAFKSSRGVILVCFVALIPITLSYRRILYRVFLHRHGNQSLIFLGDLTSCEMFLQECARNKLSQPVILASMQPVLTHPKLQIRFLPDVLSSIERGDLNAEAVVIRETNQELTSDISQRLVALHFKGTSTYTLELFHQIFWRKIPLYRINPTWLFQEGFEITREPVFERVKRLMDLFLALVALVIFTPLLALCGLAIWLEDRGPIFFRQTRIGKSRVPFCLFKLRTMKNGSDSGDPYTRCQDKRITKVGRLLRATRIDELPQIWNVLKGDMSFIGPRAEWDRLVAEYEKQIPCYHFRHFVKPGITGWAQVNYPYGANLDDTLRKLEYDLYYIRHFSFVMDASIILKTIHIMFFGKGQ